MINNVGSYKNHAEPTDTKSSKQNVSSKNKFQMEVSELSELRKVDIRFFS